MQARKIGLTNVRTAPSTFYLLRRVGASPRRLRRRFMQPGLP